MGVAPSPILFGPGGIASNLQTGLQFNNGSGPSVLTGTVNPSSVATTGVEGSLYLNSSSGITYQKQDNGSSTNWSPLALLNSAGIVGQGVQWFQKVAGTYTFTTPANSTTATIYSFIMTGGGGGGGHTTTGYLGTGGGGGGGSAIGTFTGIAPSTAITVTVGAGGSGSSGTAGGSTTIGLASNPPTVTGGGVGSTDNYGSGAGGTLTAGTGYLAIPGVTGGYGQSVAATTNAQTGGMGGGSLWGQGGYGGTNQTGNGSSAQPPGAGGGGGYLPSANGGNGADGCVLITQFNGIIGSASSSAISRSILSISSPTTLAAVAHTDYVYLVSGTTTVTMPTAVGNTNLYTIKNVDSSLTTTINTTSSQTIDGSLTITLPVPNTSLDLISDGSNWRIC